MAFLLIRSNGRHIKIASLDCGRELPHFVEAVDGIAAGSRQYWVNNTINIETLGSNLHLNCLMFINSGSRTMWTTTTPLDRNYTHHMSAICQRRSITIKSNGFISSRRDDNILSRCDPRFIYMIADNKIVQLHLAIRQVQMDGLASILPFRANVAESSGGESEYPCPLCWPSLHRPVPSCYSSHDRLYF